MQLAGCSGFHECEQQDGIYTCRVGDSNYMFEKCETLLLKPVSMTKHFNIYLENVGGIGQAIAKSSESSVLPDISEIVKDLHFEYTVEGGKFVGNNLDVKFVRREGKHYTNVYWYDCEIKRPLSFDGTPLKPVKDISLVFKSDFPLNAQWFCDSSYIGSAGQSKSGSELCIIS